MPRSHPLDQRPRPPARANRLLAALSLSDYKRFLADSVPVPLSFKTVLYEPGELLHHVYFPIDCLVSLLTAVNGHDAREVGMVGREGMIGVSLALGVDVSASRALVQGTGTALRVESPRFIDEYGRRGPFHKEVNQYIHELMVQTAQTAACNISHPVEARLARWLLMTRDRTGKDTFPLTHELLAGMLGVLRGAITKAAGSLQRQGLISYRQGEIVILEADRLEAVACRCYQIVKTLSDKSQGVNRAPLAASSS